ncbi:MAG: hypothetical protein A2Y67_02455 [Candidatus Buchananbacteria bacterium RBG_13_39_9]|uniref:Uncharacterized protein n=1 Tax=Candidatus Buchananbacteria bacterium RBG_13_39_9 TaxID=1797531 RepID=A0A1G1XTY0_9BACT|nr:MAG: hypothetical protein A2Y67_02455 [Candidatus Buchananbacteria bacterium RBG_13_39_9]
MEQEPRSDVEAKYETIIRGLSFNASKALLAILIRHGIDKRDEFRHVVDIEGEKLNEALDELTKQGLAMPNAEGYDLSPSFRDYWKKNAKQEC